MDAVVNEEKLGGFAKLFSLESAKRTAKFLKIKKISTMKKVDIVKKILILRSVIKIQRAYRERKINGDKCPISLEPITYPLYPYPVEKGRGLFRYYNLDYLKKYLIESGNFCDPVSRTPYTNEQMRQMDIIDLYNRGRVGEKHFDAYKSVLTFSKKDRHYVRKQNFQNDVLVLERVLDMSCQDIINVLLDNSVSYEVFHGVHSMYLRSYKTNFYRILVKDRDHAKYALDKNINNVVFIVGEVDQAKLGLYGHVLNYLQDIRDANF